MSFIAAMSTCTYLMLFAFLSLGCAQDASKNPCVEEVSISNGTLTIKPVHTRPQRRPLANQDSCFVPPHPANGVRRQFMRDLGSGIEFRDPTEGAEIAPATLLNYTCNSGYKLNGNPLVLCEGKGKWSPIPECIHEKCEPLNSISTTAKCFRRGRWVSCDSPVLLGTLDQVSCRPGSYSRVKSPTTTQNETVEYNMEGKWESNTTKCVPVCSEVISGTTGGFPWYASLYRQYSDGDEKYFKCGATVVRNDLVLTSASCVYNKKTNSTVDPGELFVMAGHELQKWDHPLNYPKFVRKSAVKNVYMHCDYHVKYSVADIALVEIKKPFEFSSVILPACLNDYGYGEEVLRPDAWGSIAEFGATTITKRPIAKAILSIKTVPYVPYSHCKTSNKIIEQELLASDKFCAGYHNRSSVCIHDKGGGLVFKRNDTWYVTGIVSETSDYLTFAYGRTCERYAIYTNVSEYTAWIQNVIFNLDQYKSHPPCNSNGSLNGRPTTTLPPLDNRTLPNDEDLFCLAPPQPANGEWRFNQSLCQDEADCTILEGTPLIPGTQLNYSCDPGCKAKGSTEVYCGFSGNWSTIPLCTEIKCDSLNSVSMTASCYDQSGLWVSCNSPVPPGTVAEISCQSGYREDTTLSTLERKTVKCSGRGEWTPDPIRCVPVCGVVVPRRLNDFPWHATLYMQRNSSKGITKDFICGATIVQTNFLLTAAHCIYEERTRTTVDPEKLFVITGNSFRDYDSPFHNHSSIWKTAVKNVYRPCKYQGLRGNYASDIALLELQTPLRVSSMILPACLYVDNDIDQILEPGAIGQVASFGRTATGEFSDILQTLTQPYISYDDCKISKNDVLISDDKFCAGYITGSTVCEGGSGGGLVFKKSESWYVVGIVSVGLGFDLDNGEITCDRHSYSLYTKVSEHMTWIQDVMFQRAQGIPYPSCDADV